MEANDYKHRTYLSAVEAAGYLGISVERLHLLVKEGAVTCFRAASGQMRFALADIKGIEAQVAPRENATELSLKLVNAINLNGTTQRVVVADATRMGQVLSNSVHLMVTSPPYFDTKMYSRSPIAGDLGDVHDVDEWFARIAEVWSEVFRVLQPGRKAFINIMNLPIRLATGGYRTLNLVGRTVDQCERIGFIFKRDIIWHKTNAVRAHFGSYPYPGGILINNMHEFILEFNKPERKGGRKYAHLTPEQKEQSLLDKEFWLSLKSSDVWMMKPHGSGDRRNHAAPFPYELPFRLIKAFSYVGETVLDPFSGSGTTLLAAADLKRDGIGYEINPAIAAASIETIKNRRASQT